VCVCFDKFTYSYGIIARDIAIAGDRGLFPGTVERCLNKKWWLLAFARYRQHRR
jgi:hypothetical protein